MSGDADLAELLDEVRGYPGSGGGRRRPDPARLLFLPIVIEGPDGDVLSFFSTLATFGTALDITLAELSIEAFFPADARTRDLLG